MNINNALDKAWETKPLKEIADAPVDVLQGISERTGAMLKDVFHIKTVRDLASWKYARWARAIVDLADTEE
jgi:hypothetical protein